jgi:transcriptional regulator with XRE-family HTH domain
MSNYNFENIGTRIRTLRGSRKMPLRKLAALLDVDQSTLSKIERGKRKANIKIIKDLSTIFKTDYQDLLVIYYSDKVYDVVQEDPLLYDKILKLAKEKVTNKLKDLKK